MQDGRVRVVIDNVLPQVDGGRFPIKRAVGERVDVVAEIFADGHDVLSVVLLTRAPGASDWSETPMHPGHNDRWHAHFMVDRVGYYTYTVRAWVDHFTTWRNDLKKRIAAGQDLEVQFLRGAQFVDEALQAAGEKPGARELGHALSILRAPSDQSERVALAFSDDLARLLWTHLPRGFVAEAEKPLRAVVERPKALFSTWYERFPRSCSPVPGRHGTFRDCIAVLPEIARMGFDTWYLPPIHPIGEVRRKGKNNSPEAAPGDVGSPWAVGSRHGGHKAIHPELGTFEDFAALIAAAKEQGIEIALDIAFQCSPDHPWVAEHPGWFTWLPDGSVQHAENPPKKYEDIIPLNFECPDWENLWAELRSVFLFWAERGVRMFRVDNPHTKSFRFWEWVIRECKEVHPDLIFLSEAFTRPKVMYHLAKVGFTQSYTYFTWRNTKPEFMDYMTHLLNTGVREFFRPNFWPNTPDILPEHLQYGGRAAFRIRLVLAATMSSSYGIYGPPFELCIGKALPGKEEYADSEKYELVVWGWDAPGNIKDFIARMNTIRRENPALQTTWNLRFYHVDNEYLCFYGKATDDLSNIILVLVNLDPHHTQSGWVTVPIRELGIAADQPYLVHELLGDTTFIWHGEKNYVELNPETSPALVFRVRKRMRRETDFDYYL